MPNPLKLFQLHTWRRGFLNRTFVITLTGVVIFAIFSVSVDRFLTTENLLNMLRQIDLLGILSVGMTFLFVVGAIGISIGSAFRCFPGVMGILVGRRRSS